MDRSIRKLAEWGHLVGPVSSVNGTYESFLESKRQLENNRGFEPLWIPDWLFDFQKHLVSWNLVKGRSATFADCGMGKTPMQLVWAQNVVEHANRPVLIVTPLAVSYQTLEEAEKFDIECRRSKDGKIRGGKGIWITNYERLEHFNPDDFVGMVCDESSILKSFSGAYKSQIVEFMRRLPYRLLCTATAAPNDYHELGNSSEALGEMGFRDMITAYFKQDTDNGLGWGRTKYRFKGHAEKFFWRWICSWSRSCRRPSDLGDFSDDDFKLPELKEVEHVIRNEKISKPGDLFGAKNLQEERRERRDTLERRCEKVAELVDHDDYAVCWCHLNDEADLLEKLIPDSSQVSGSMSDDLKEERLKAFTDQQLRVLIIKPKIGAFGLNWQHCCRVVTFASHSFEQHYQAVRRCWRFGQTRNVKVDLVVSDTGVKVLRNLRRKSKQADRMFDNLVREMSNSLSITTDESFELLEEIPRWL